MAEEPKKHFITIVDKDGKYAPQPLAQCNAEADGLRMGARKRRAGILKRITEMVSAELKRA